MNIQRWVNNIPVVNNETKEDMVAAIATRHVHILMSQVGMVAVISTQRQSTMAEATPGLVSMFSWLMVTALLRPIALRLLALVCLCVHRR